VSFLGTGPLPPNPAEVLDTHLMRSLLAEARELFDVVILDAPPLLPVADAAILLTEVDGGLLLIRHGTTHREELRRAVSRAQAVGGKILGTVVNRAPLGGKSSSYGYYGYGYGYGDYRSEPSKSGRAGASKGRRARR
jgi:receptor protein-tyrosine kinase